MKIIAEKEKETVDVLEYMRSICIIPRYEPMKTTLVDWCNYWLQTYSSNIKESTRSAYESVITNHISRVFKDMKLEEVTNEDIQLFINSLDIGYQLPEPLKPKTIKNIHGVLHKALEVAVKHKCITTNCAEGIVLPTPDKKTPTPLSDSQLLRFFKRIENHEKRDIFLFALYTGLRESEIIGLTWDCFNPDEHTLNVYRQLSYNRHEHKFCFTSLKNSKTRVLTLTQQAYNILIMLYEKADTPKNDDFVFKNRENNHFTPPAVYNSLKKVMRSIDLPQVTFHDLRHTHAVISIKAGIDIKTLQYNMGHFSAAFTLDVYGHCLDEMRKQGAEQLGEYMKKYE